MDRTEQDKIKDLTSFREALLKRKQPMEVMVNNVLEFISRSKRVGDTSRGKNASVNIYDGTGPSALNTWAAGMYGKICSSQLNWFSFRLPLPLEFPRYSLMRSMNGKRMDEIPEVSRWLDDCGEVLQSAFHRSNFYSVMPQFFREGGGPGTAAMYAEEELTTGKTLFQVMHFREFALAENKAGSVDTMFREIQLTLKQLAEKFGESKMSELIRDFGKRYKKNPYEEMTVVHGTLPRADFDPKKKDNKNMPWASFWWLKEKPDKLLGESGFEYFPYIAWRYRKETDENGWGRSPGWDAYTDVMKANQEAKTNLTAGHKIADPPMVGLKDLRGMVNKNAAGWTWVERMTDQPLPLQTGINLPYSEELLNRTQKIIENYYHIQYFSMLSRAAYEKVQLTATQVIQMEAEEAGIFGSMTDSLHVDVFDPIIDLMWDIEVKSGRMPPPPQIVLDMARMQGIRVEVDYLGPLAQSQRSLFETQGIRAGLEVMGWFGQVDPACLKRVNFDESLQQALRAVGFPAKAIRTDEEVDAINKAQERQQQDMLAAQGMMEAAKALPSAGKAIEANSPLALMTGVGQEASNG